MDDLSGKKTESGAALPEEDVRQLVRLIADCATVQGGVMAQKRRLVEGLTALLDADYWMWNVSRITEDGTIVAVSILHNLSERQLAYLADENYSSPDNPCNRAMIALSRDNASWSRRIEDMVDREDDPDSHHTSKPEIDMGQSLFAFHRVADAPDLASAVGIHRAYGREPFTKRELRLAHIVMSEVSWLHDSSLPGEDGLAIAALSPRLQTVLTLLMDGQAAKRIALHLGLSPHTVRGYIKDIYRHFEVSSRSDLMRRFMVGDGSDRVVS